MSVKVIQDVKISKTEEVDSGQLPQDWDVFNLGKLLDEVKVKYRHVSDTELDIPVLSMTRHHGLILQQEKFDKRVAGRDLSNYRVIRKNQIACGFPMEEGVIYALTKYDSGLISPAYYVWELTSEDVDIVFLDYLLKTEAMIETYRRLTSKTVQRRRIVKQKDFKQIRIKLPPLQEQKAIAHILSTVQQAKEKTEQVIQATKELKKSLMKHLFTYGAVSLDEAPNVKLKETEIGMVPEEWQYTTLGNAVTLQRGRDLPKSKRVQGDVPVIGSNGVVGYHTESVADGLGVFVGRSGSVGKVSWVEGEYWPLNTTLWCKDFYGNSPIFIYYFLSSFDLSKYASGVSVPTLNRNLVHPIKIGLPDLAEQEKISTILLEVDAKIVQEEYRLQALEQLFKTLLNYLMTGKIRVGNLDSFIEKLCLQIHR